MGTKCFRIGNFKRNDFYAVWSVFLFEVHFQKCVKIVPKIR